MVNKKEAKNMTLENVVTEMPFIYTVLGNHIPEYMAGTPKYWNHVFHKLKTLFDNLKVAHLFITLTLNDKD